MNLEAIAGGLIGSVTTVIITKGLDIWAEKGKNKFQLKRVFFEKKLSSGEAMMASYYTVTSAMSGLDAIYSQVKIERDQKINWNLFSEYVVSFETKLRELGKSAGSANDISLSFPLYFDLGEGFWRTDLHQEYISSMFRIANLVIPMQTAIKIANENTDPNMNEWCHENVENKWDEIRKEMVSLAPVIKRIKEEMTNAIKMLRQEMKKYEG
jgi:hypothetical protein